MRKQLSLVCAVFAVGVLMFWALAGANLRTTIKHEVPIKDTISGVTPPQPLDQFSLGADFAIPMILIFGGVSYFLLRSQRPIRVKRS
jgi:hypothetical protein